MLGHITSLAISSDNKYIVSGGSDLAIKLFDFERRNFICGFYNCHKCTRKLYITVANLLNSGTKDSESYARQPVYRVSRRGRQRQLL